MRLLFSGLSLYILAGCATTKPTPNADTPPPIIVDIKNAPIAAPVPDTIPETVPDTLSDTVSDTLSDTVTEPIAGPNLPELEPVVEPEPVKPPSFDSGFKNLKFWQTADPRPALSAFQKTCQIWRKKEGEHWQENEHWLDDNHHVFGKIKDWQAVCSFALEIKNPNRSAAVHFFQSHFEPVTLSSNPQIGLLTGYYAPEVEVRLKADKTFNAPLLALPTAPEIQNLPRKSLSATSSKVLAYGRPIDVFFLQVQGSGRIIFKDGTSYMAAYAGHNNHKYKSIGRVLIQRGELDRDSVSKQAIETWMDKAGPEEAQKLMNENPRYIYFKTQHVGENSQPKGAVGAPLTPLGSMAIDPRHMPYGALVWLETRLPEKGGDFNGQAAGFLVITQDTGSAIKGRFRGDLYFGIGDAAGAKAGVMKHKAAWTILLPVPLAVKAHALALVVADLS